MGLLQQASLVVTPNAYKASKLYSVIPTNGTGDLDVVRATSATRVNSAGLIESVGNNIPRLDYTNASCPSILIEPQRTNLFSRSEEFENLNWVKVSATIMQNSTISPSGVMNADMITSNSTSLALAVQLSTIVSGATYSTTFYAKQNTQRFVYIRFTSNALQNNYVSVVFDLQDGTVGQTSVGTTSGTLINATATSVANGFYRITLVASINVTDGNIGIGFAPSKTGNTFNVSGTITSDITIGNSIFIWGAQLEVGSNATSYIPTTTTSVTRNADVISKSGISSLIGQSQGSLVYYFIKNSSNSIPNISLSNNGTNPRFYPFESGTNYVFFLQSATVLVNYLYPLNNFIIGLNKIGITYGAGSFKIYINGSVITSVPYTEQNLSFSKLNIGSAVTNVVGNTSNNNLVLINKEILSESEMIQLTTL